MGRVRWRTVAGWALAGSAIAVLFTLVNLQATFDTLGGLVDAGPHDKVAPILAQDLPSYPLSEGGRHDGSMFYAVAREPMHPTEAADSLDRPRYRLQRILYPWLAWVLHPTGGGEGLVWAMFAVGVAGVIAGSFATGALSMELGGPPWPAIVFGLCSGAFTALRISTPDPLALAFVFWALWFALRRRVLWAVLLGVAAALTKETTLLFLVGYLLFRRDREAVVITAVPVAVTGAWWLWLRVLLPDTGNQVVEFVTPFAGWSEAVRFWAHGHEPLGLLSFVAAVVLSVLALVRGGLRHPFGWAILLNVVMFVVLSASAIAPERSAGRTTMGALVLAVVVLTTFRTWPKALRADSAGLEGRDPALA